MVSSKQHSFGGSLDYNEVVTVEQIIEEIRNLPQEEQNRVFAELKRKQVDRVFGKYKHVLTSGEEFSELKRLEKELEDRRDLRS